MRRYFITRVMLGLDPAVEKHLFFSKSIFKAGKKRDRGLTIDEIYSTYMGRNVV